MSVKVRLTMLLVLSSLVILCVASGCAKEKKQVKLEVTEHEYTIDKDSEDSNVYTIDVRGTVRNSGEVDVKNVTVTAYCRTCGEQIVNGQWFVSEYDKMPHQKDVISYLAAGASEDFEFEEVAFYSAPAGVPKPKGVPEDEKFEIVIESYKVVE